MDLTKDGKSSNDQKKSILMNLFQRMGPKETKFAIRFLLKNYKIGANEAIMEMALGASFCLNYFKNKQWYETKAVSECLKMLSIEKSEKKSEDIKKVISKFRNLSFENKVRFFVQYFKKVENFRKKNKFQPEEVTEEIKNKWIEDIRMILSQYPFHQNMIETFLILGNCENSALTCCLTPGVPCKPMLAKPTRAISDIFSRFEGKKFTCEFKYDGLRGQIHYYSDTKTGKKKIELFSRNLENMTEIYQDLVEPIEIFAEKNNLKSFIIDTEIMAFNSKANQILSFQALSTRSRTKDNVQQKDQVEVKLFVFDILLSNDQNILLESFENRRKFLENLDWSHHQSISRANFKDLTNLEEVQGYLEESVNNGCEGLMVKTLDIDATYQPSKRSFKWLKLKKDYLMNQGLGDSFDLVIIGAGWGEGKRTGKFGTFLVASYNDAMDSFESCCRVGSGFSDVDLEDLYERLKDKVGFCRFFC